MKKLAAVLDEVFEEVEHFWVGVGHGFGVPLDGLAVMFRGTPVDGFDDTVGGGSGDFASGSYAFCGLVVVGIDSGFETEDRLELAAWKDIDMVGGDFSVCLLGVLDQVAGFAANFLPQGATKGYGHNLQASADAKDGLFESIDFAK